MRESREKKKQRRKDMREAVKMELREHRSSFTVYLVLRIFVITILILQILNRNYEHVFLCILTLILLVIPSFLQVNFKIEFPTTLEIIILLFIFASQILGEISEFYIRFPFWDTMLHTLNGFLAAAIGFSLVDLLNKNERFAVNLSPLFISIVAFCFSMTIGVLWEIFEYGMDCLAGFDTQKDTIVNSFTTVLLDPLGGNSPVLVDDINEVIINGKELNLGGYIDIGLHDTMMDMIVNLVGAVVFSVFGYFYVKHRGKGKMVKRFIPTVKAEERDFLAKIKRERKKNK